MKAPDPEKAQTDIFALVRSKNFEAALFQCTEWLTTCKRADVHDFLALRSYVLWSAGEKTAAIADARIAAFLKPTWPAHLHRLMRWYIDLGEYDRSVASAKKLVLLERKRNSEAFLKSAYIHALFGLAHLGRLNDFDSFYNAVDPSDVERIQGRDWSADEIRRLLRREAN